MHDFFYTLHKLGLWFPAQVVTGSHAMITVGGKPIAFAKNVNYSVNSKLSTLTLTPSARVQGRFRDMLYRLALYN